MTANLLFDRAAQRRLRDRIADRFTEHAFLLERVAGDFADRLAVTLRDFETCVVLGEGCDVVSGALTALSNTGLVVGTDFSEPLCRSGAGLRVVCDEEFVPFAAQSLNLVAAPLCLHHVNDLPGCLIQIRRALKADGLFLASVFGGDTLHELRACLLMAEDELTGGVSARVAPFADVRELGGLLQRAGLALPVADTDVVNVRYGSMTKLMHDLRGMGLSNTLASRRRAFSSRALFERAEEIYRERFSEDGKLVATFELVTLTGWAPHESQQKPLRPGSAQTRLADALGTQEFSTGEKSGDS